MTSILPAVIQDFLYQHVDNKTKYADISEKVKAWVGNRVAIVNEPIPIDIGEVGWGSDDYNMQAEETDIDMVVCAWTKCHRCDGYGHLSRDCATQVRARGRTAKVDKRAMVRAGTSPSSSSTSTTARAKGRAGRRAGVIVSPCSFLCCPLGSVPPATPTSRRYRSGIGRVRTSRLVGVGRRAVLQEFAHCKKRCRGRSVGNDVRPLETFAGQCERSPHVLFARRAIGHGWGSPRRRRDRQNGQIDGTHEAKWTEQRHGVWRRGSEVGVQDHFPASEPGSRSGYRPVPARFVHESWQRVRGPRPPSVVRAGPIGNSCVRRQHRGIRPRVKMLHGLRQIAPHSLS